MKWFKLWSEVRNDAKLRSLSPEERWTWLSLLCYSSEQEKRGTICLPTKLVAAETCGSDVQKLVTTCNELASLRLIQVTTCNEENVDITFPAFAERQAKSPSDDPGKVRERVQKYRRQQVTTPKAVTTCNEFVTSGNDIQKQKQIQNLIPPPTRETQPDPEPFHDDPEPSGVMVLSFPSPANDPVEVTQVGNLAIDLFSGWEYGRNVSEAAKLYPIATIKEAVVRSHAKGKRDWAYIHGTIAGLARQNWMPDLLGQAETAVKSTRVEPKILTAPKERTPEEKAKLTKGLEGLLEEYERDMAARPARTGS